jgi:uncharacterized protein
MFTMNIYTIYVTSLHYTALRGDVRFAGLLLSSGAFVDVVNEFGETPLLFAVWKGHVSTVRMLLANGANPLAKSRWNRDIETFTDDRIREMLKAADGRRPVEGVRWKRE